MRANMLPKNDLEKIPCLEHLMIFFEENKIYAESEVNELIKEHSNDDHVLIRRELVNFNFLGKDSYQGTYWVKQKNLSEQEQERIKQTLKNILKIK